MCTHIYIYIHISCLLTGRQINILNHIKSAHHALRLWNPPSNSTKTCPPRCFQRQPRARGWDRWKPGLWVEVPQQTLGEWQNLGNLFGETRGWSPLYSDWKRLCSFEVVAFWWLCRCALMSCIGSWKRFQNSTQQLEWRWHHSAPRSLHLQPPWFGEGKWWCLSSHLYSVCTSLFIFVLFICLTLPLQLSEGACSTRYEHHSANVTSQKILDFDDFPVPGLWFCQVHLGICRCQKKSMEQADDLARQSRGLGSLRMRSLITAQKLPSGYLT